MDDSHTLAVLCSGFNDAPAAGPRLLLERAKEAGVRDLEGKTALLVLPRPNEALAVKDEAGDRVESIEEGYELKGEQVAQSLQPLGMQNMSVEFFNSFQDDPATLQSFLTEQIFCTRKSFRNKLENIISNARLLLSNYEHEQTRAVISQAARQLGTWLDQHPKPTKLTAHVQDSLLGQMSQAYAATVRATISREGERHNLNYWHHLGHGARRMATLSLGSLVQSFSEVCSNIAATPDYTEAMEMISQADRLLESSYEDLLTKVQIMGQTAYRNALKSDKELWRSCESERGIGYRDRVIGHNRDWFNQENRLEIESELIAMIEREWQGCLARIAALFDSDD